MSIDIILYILAVMIFLDFSLHVFELFGLDVKFIRSKSIFSYYYPHFRWIKTPNGPIERPNWNLIYQRFWVTFWGLAFLLLIIYLIFK
jgi:hypothetical protein